MAGLVIRFTGLSWLDPLVSILIGVLIVWNAWGILRETMDILLESTPRDIDLSAVVRGLRQVEGVRGVHDLHVWSLTQSLRALSAHILTDDIPISAGADIQREINAMLNQTYGIAHATLQLECRDCEPDLLYCNLAEAEDEHAAQPAQNG